MTWGEIQKLYIELMDGIDQMVRGEDEEMQDAAREIMTNWMDYPTSLTALEEAIAEVRGWQEEIEHQQWVEKHF